MFCRRNLTVVGILVMLLAGTLMDAYGKAVIDPRGCDHDCRERRMHYFCTGGGLHPCVRFDLDTCLFCDPGGSCRCVNTNPVALPNCVPATINPNTTLRKYQFCDNVCPCDGPEIVEATNFSGDFTTPPGMTRYNCAP